MPSSDRIIRGSPNPSADVPAALPAAGGRPAPGRRVLGSSMGVSAHDSPPAMNQAGVAVPSQAGAADQALGDEVRRAVAEAERRGHAEGLARAERELAAAVAAAGALAVELERAVPRQAPILAALITECAITIARRILDVEIQANPAALCGALEEAMDGLNGSPEVRVLLHPAALAPVRDAWFEAHGAAHEGKRWTFEADGTLPIGGCVIRHEHGFVDAGLEAQLAEVQAALDRVVPLVGRVTREKAA